MHAKLLPSCLTLCDPMNCSPPGSSVNRILQARILEWVAIPFSRGSSWLRDRTHISYVRQTHSPNMSWNAVSFVPQVAVYPYLLEVSWIKCPIQQKIVCNVIHGCCCFSHIWLFETLWSHQAPLSIGFSRLEYWSGLPCPPPGDLPDSGIEPAYPATPVFPVDSLLRSHQGSPLQCSTWP